MIEERLQMHDYLRRQAGQPSCGGAPPENVYSVELRREMCAAKQIRKMGHAAAAAQVVCVYEEY